MDEDFPRGTASRPSTRSADGKKTKTKCFVQLGVKRGVEDVLFKESEQETPSKGKKRKTKKNDGGGTEEEPNIEEEFEGMVENEGSIPKPLSAKTLNEGMLVLAVVQEIHEYEIVLSLPNGLTAFVQITDVSSFFTQQLQEMNESSNADDQDLPNIQDLYKVGNLVPCKIKSLTSSKDGHRRIQASLDYKEVNSELGISFIKPGMTLNGCVSSVEDHGYTIDLGIRGTNAFLAKEDSTKKGAKGRKGETMKTGKLVTCLVKAVKANGRSIILTFDAERLKSCKATKTSHTTFSSLIPGTKMDAMVTKILPNSLILDIFGLYKGCVDPIHLKDSADELTKYSIGQKLTAVVLYNCPTTKSIGLSLNPAHHKVTFDPAIDVTRDLSPGDIIEDALVVRVQAKENVILQLNTKTRGIVYHSHFSDDDKQKRQSPVSVGEVRCRILSFNLFDRLAIVSLKKSILDKPFLGINDVQPGLLVKGVIESVVPRGVAVKIQDRIHGFVPRTHLADIPVQKPQERFTVGSEIELRVLLVEPAKRRVLLTHKKTMVKSSLPILSSYSQPKVGMWVHGCVVAVKDFGCIVSFYNDVKGIIPRAELGMDESSSPTDNFYVGQVLKCRVLRTHSPESKKLSLSLKKDGRLERESFEAGKISTVNTPEVPPRLHLLLASTLTSAAESFFPDVSFNSIATKLLSTQASQPPHVESPQLLPYRSTSSPVPFCSASPVPSCTPSPVPSCSLSPGLSDLLLQSTVSSPEQSTPRSHVQPTPSTPVLSNTSRIEDLLEVLIEEIRDLKRLLQQQQPVHSTFTNPQQSIDPRQVQPISINQSQAQLLSVNAHLAQQPYFDSRSTQLQCINPQTVNPPLSTLIVAQQTPSIDPRPQHVYSTFTNHQPAQQSSINAQPGQQSSINAQPGQQPSINTQLGQQPSINAQPGQQSSINAQPAQQPSINSQPGQQSSINAQPAQQPSINAQPGQQSSFDSRPAQLQSINPQTVHPPLSKPILAQPTLSIDQKQMQQPFINSQLAQLPSTNAQPTYPPSINPKQSQPLSNDQSPAQSLSINDQSAQQTFIDQRQVQPPSIDQRQAMSLSINAQQGQQPSIDQRPTHLSLADPQQVQPPFVDQRQAQSQSINAQPTQQPSPKSKQDQQPSINSKPDQLPTTEQEPAEALYIDLQPAHLSLTDPQQVQPPFVDQRQAQSQSINVQPTQQPSPKSKQDQQPSINSKPDQLPTNEQEPAEALYIDLQPAHLSLTDPKPAQQPSVDPTPNLPSSIDPKPVHLCLTQATTHHHTSRDNSMLNPLSQDSEYLSSAELLFLKTKSCSIPNFAVKIARRLFSKEEFKESNCAGARGKSALDATRLMYIWSKVQSVCNIEDTDFPKVLRSCRIAIDLYARKVK